MEFGNRLTAMRGRTRRLDGARRARRFGRHWSSLGLTRWECAQENKSLEHRNLIDMMKWCDEHYATPTPSPIAKPLPSHKDAGGPPCGGSKKEASK